MQVNECWLIERAAVQGRFDLALCDGSDWYKHAPDSRHFP